MEKISCIMQISDIRAAVRCRISQKKKKRENIKWKDDEMNYQEFVGSVTGFLRETLPCETELELVSMEKNNGVIMDGLTIRKKGQTVAPTIYLDSYYRDYLAGRSMQNICDRILDCCEDSSFLNEFDVNFFTDYRKIRPTVVYKLIHYEKNRELLERIPHLPFLDLAIVFYCLLTDTPVGNATVLIHNSHMKLWNISCSDLYQDAKRNALRLLPAEFKTMSEIICEISEGQEDTRESDVPMYVLTNIRRVLGAVCILYDGVLDSCASRIGSAYYLLPSSIHEMILIPEEVVLDAKELVSMVREINETQVRSTEVLSDQIYFYSPESRQISMIKV